MVDCSSNEPQSTSPRGANYKEGIPEYVRLAGEMCDYFSWELVATKKPFSRNLMNGKERFSQWVVKGDEHGRKVKDNCSVIEGAERQTCFVTPIKWCEKSQMIDLLQEGLWEHFLDVHQPVISISDWYGGRQDYVCDYEIKVELLAADKKTVLQEFTKTPDPIPPGNDAQYYEIFHQFLRYGPGVRYVTFTHKGKDPNVWNWYGSQRLYNSSVTVNCDLMEPCI